MKLTKQIIRKLIIEALVPEYDLTFNYDVRDLFNVLIPAGGEDEYLEWTESGAADEVAWQEISNLITDLGISASIIYHEPEMGIGSIIVRGTQEDLLNLAFQHHQSTGAGFSFNEAEVISAMAPVAMGNTYI